MFLENDTGEKNGEKEKKENDENGRVQRVTKENVAKLVKVLSYC